MSLRSTPTNDGSRPDPGAVQIQLKRILNSSAFKKSEQQREFLRTLVEETLNGRSEALKETWLGEKVFHRGPDFDPATDNIVRVRAGDLRKRLDIYYSAEGAGDDLVIAIPKGAYVPMFCPRSLLVPASSSLNRHYQTDLVPEARRSETTAKDDKGPPQRKLRWSLLALVLVTLTALVFARMLWNARPPRYRLADSAWDRTPLIRESGFAGHPAPAPDGQRFAFTSDRDDEGDLDVWMQPLRGPAVQLTDLPGNERTPDWSPDGNHIAFQSDSEGGGIYMVSLATRQLRRLSDFGYHPRFSPDGRWIAFTGQKGTNKASVFLVSTGGGAPLPLSLGPYDSYSPLWHPNGPRLVFLSEDVHHVFDWRVAEMALGALPHVRSVRALGLNDAVRRAGMWPLLKSDLPSDWIGNTVLYARSSYDGIDLGCVPLSVPQWKLRNEPYLLMHGPLGGSVRVIPSPPGLPIEIIYSAEASNTQVYGFPVTGATVRGEPRGLTRNTRISTDWSLSHDGDRLVYRCSPHASNDVMLVDTASGRETPIANSVDDEENGVISPAGKTIAYIRWRDDKAELNLTDVETRSTRRLCGDCGYPTDFSPDGKTLLLVKDGALLSLDITSGRVVDLLRKSGIEILDTNVDPTGKWVALGMNRADQAETKLFLAPMGPDRLGSESEWIDIGSQMYSFQADWSFDGEWIFFFRMTDGYRCLWAQRLHPRTKRPLGDPIVVRHCHRFQRYPTGAGRVAAASGMLVMNLTEVQSDIWKATLEAR